MVEAGVDVFRLNLAHGDRGQHEATVSRLEEVRSRSRPLALLVDLAGPKIRLGPLPEDPLICHDGDELQFVRGPQSHGPTQLTSSYDRLIDDLQKGDSVMLADGNVGMVVLEKNDERALCRVVHGGSLRSRQGINLPGVELSVPALTEYDRVCIDWVVQHSVDYVSLSFVRSAAEIHELRELLRTHDCQAHIVAKIEKPEALDRLDEVVRAADAVMVARGDLGVETDVAQVPAAQKRIIATCNRYQRPVIVATQMLDSMQREPRPTRAEASDVANAILDGADACMLSGETAIGDYPTTSVQTMNRIMLSTEQLLTNKETQRPNVESASQVSPITRAVVYGAACVAELVHARLVVCRDTPRQDGAGQIGATRLYPHHCRQ